MIRPETGAFLGVKTSKVGFALCRCPQVMFRASARFSRLAALPAIAMLAGASGPSCSKSDNSDSGSLGLTVVRAKGPRPPTTTVTYTILSSSNAVILGPSTFVVVGANAPSRSTSCCQRPRRATRRRSAAFRDGRF